MFVFCVVASGVVFASESSEKCMEVMPSSWRATLVNSIDSNIPVYRGFAGVIDDLFVPSGLRSDGQAELNGCYVPYSAELKKSIESQNQLFFLIENTNEKDGEYEGDRKFYFEPSNTNELKKRIINVAISSVKKGGSVPFPKSFVDSVKKKRRSSAPISFDLRGIHHRKQDVAKIKDEADKDVKKKNDEQPVLATPSKTNGLTILLDDGSSVASYTVSLIQEDGKLKLSYTDKNNATCAKIGLGDKNKQILNTTIANRTDQNQKIIIGAPSQSGHQRVGLLVVDKEVLALLGLQQNEAEVPKEGNDTTPKKAPDQFKESAGELTRSMFSMVGALLKLLLPSKTTMFYSGITFIGVALLIKLIKNSFFLK